MYEDDRHSDFEPVTHSGISDSEIGRGELGRHIAGLGAVAMLIGIAIAIHTMMPQGGQRTTLIMLVSGVAVWVIASFALHLGSERMPLLVMLFPTLIFLAVLIVVLAFAQDDFPEGFERIHSPAPQHLSGAND
jgi:SNF family Na+-dependent transporter